MVNAKAYGPNQILKDIAALRGALANLQQNGTFKNITVNGTTTLNGQVLATGGTDVTPSNYQTDVWTTVTAPTNSTGTVRFKLLGFNAVLVNVEIVPNSSSAANAALQLFAMPAASYIPAVQQRGNVGFFANGTPTLAQLQAMCQMRWQANPNGTFNILNYVGGAAGSGVIEVSFNCIYATDQ